MKAKEKVFRGTWHPKMEGFLEDEGTEHPFVNMMENMFDPFTGKDKKDVEIEIIVRKVE